MSLRAFSSYDVRFKNLLLAGAKKSQVLPPTDKGTAIKLRQEIQEYRAAAKKHFGDERKEEWEPLYQAIVRIRSVLDSKPATWQVIIEPRSARFEGLLPSIEEVTAHSEGGGGADLNDLLNEVEQRDPTDVIGRSSADVEKKS